MRARAIHMRCTAMLLTGLLAAISPPRYPQAFARAESSTGPIMSVSHVYSLCQRHAAAPGVPLATVRVRGYNATIPFPGGHASLGVLFDRKPRPGTAFQSVRVPLPGSDGTVLGVKVRHGGLVVFWPDGGPSTSTQPIPDEPPVGVALIARGSLVCRDLHESMSSYFVNGRGNPYLIARGWTPSA